MNQEYQGQLHIINFERQDDLQRETVRITKSTQNMICYAAETLGVEFDVALELLVNYGSNPLLQDFDAQ